MFYVDSQKTVTHRESSLIVRRDSAGRTPSNPNQNRSTGVLVSDSVASLANRFRGSVRKEVVTSLFDSMLDSIVKSWETIETKVAEDAGTMDKTISEVTFTGGKKKKLTSRPSRTTKKSRSRLDVIDDYPQSIDPMQQVWWSSPDEKAVVKFINGNTYEGNISMKCMHGEGRFRWSDGTVYLGNFDDNEIVGKGTMFWKDDTWYKGDFEGNVRHGKGIYVDSRKQRSYSGEWDRGTKHGKGLINYDTTFHNNYVGEWEHNVRHGFGAREYSATSGYEGYWDRYVREGHGCMIWENNDFYEGGWVNGVMSGTGMYLWSAFFNNNFVMPVMPTYQGEWDRGKRQGKGLLNFGLPWGASYKGMFKENKKEGPGKLVTNDGLILYDSKLFIDDIMALPIQSTRESKVAELEIPYDFDISNESAGLRYHIRKAYENLDREAEITASLVSQYIEKNKDIESDVQNIKLKPLNVPLIDSLYDEELLHFEETALENALKYHETNLKEIYHKYATICSDDETNFTPQLIRLLMWQFFWDCGIHAKGKTLVEIDEIFHANPIWLSKKPHDPFEPIAFWQFRNWVIAVAYKLYGSRVLPGPRPDTIVAKAFRHFMHEDAMPGFGKGCGHFSQGFASFIPLKALYGLYYTLGEPHTVRKFIQSVRRAPHETRSSVDIIDGPDEFPLGHNVYVFGNKILLIRDDLALPFEKLSDYNGAPDLGENKDLVLFNFSNLSTRAIVKIFANIFPQVSDGEKVLDLEVEMTFLEFFEAFIKCAEESIHVKEEEVLWREMFEKQNVSSHNNMYTVSPKAK